jgi:hypothetical protein
MTFSALAAILTLETSLLLFAQDIESFLKILRAPNEQVRVIGVRHATSVQLNPGDLLIDIENLSEKPIRFIYYTLAPADCPSSDHPVSFGVGYGDWSAVSPRKTTTDSPIPAHGRREISFPASIYSGFLNYQKSHGCSPRQRPELTLDKVAFCDGTGWEGFADGPDHSEWNGRDWKPAGRSNCAEPNR